MNEESRLEFQEIMLDESITQSNYEEQKSMRSNIDIWDEASPYCLSTLIENQSTCASSPFTPTPCKLSIRAQIKQNANKLRAQKLSGTKSNIQLQQHTPQPKPKGKLNKPEAHPKAPAALPAPSFSSFYRNPEQLEDI